jgi:hypothetical protein
MADELTLTGFFRVEKDGVRETETIDSATHDIAADPVYIAAGVMNLGTSAEAIPMGDVAAAGLAYFKNCDDTNYCEIGIDSSGFLAFLKLAAGRECMVWLGTNAPYAKANTGAVPLKYKILSA